MIDRARQRYAVDLDDAAVLALARQCRDFGGVLLDRKAETSEFTGPRERWLVTHGERVMIAVYSRRENRIVTLLPQDAKKHPGLVLRERAEVRARQQASLGSRKYKAPALRDMLEDE